MATESAREQKINKATIVDKLLSNDRLGYLIHKGRRLEKLSRDKHQIPTKS